jgi:hypothetical protein
MGGTKKYNLGLTDRKHQSVIEECCDSGYAIICSMKLLYKGADV